MFQLKIVHNILPTNAFLSMINYQSRTPAIFAKYLTKQFLVCL